MKKKAPAPAPVPENSDDELINNADPARTIAGLRDMGYDFYTAAADIIDNSIAAGATDIKVSVVLHEDGRKMVMFGDNGSGMTETALRDALRYGSPPRPSAKSLGKFGLGLKTASSSCCKHFVVVTRTKASEKLVRLGWDIELVESTNKWLMVRGEVSELETKLFQKLCGKSGTLVVWSKCDRVLVKNYDPPGGTAEQNAINKRTDKLIEHLSKVFHKFLDPKFKEFSNVNITVNGQKLKPFNPFYPERSEQLLSESETVLEIERQDGSTKRAYLRAWILPHTKEMTKEENDTYAKITSRGQGFYIYREGRMIFSEGWLGVFRSDDQHFSLFRAELCFDHDLDEAFQVDVKKSRIIFDVALEEELRKRLAGPWQEANRRYRRKVQDDVISTLLDHTTANTSIEKAKGRTKKPEVDSVNQSTGVATLNNNCGKVTIKTSVQNNIAPDKLYIDAVTDITNGNLWEPCLRSTGKAHHSTAVRLNKHHDFYSKVYLKASASKYAVEGIDLLLWAISTAEYNNSNAEVRAIFEDLREEVSSNLRKLLIDVPMPDEQDLAEAAESSRKEK